eukprot:TRINITY_DN219_c3_g1_i1.p1 TRINITY_DN219_c3_g1~~TRINITY_DN219_c3_g1_i1.p1  ORF type:complete len:298 (+),score=112.81 TRINITY_DN219_c3_g1_i1:35-895(+)
MDQSHPPGPESPAKPSDKSSEEMEDESKPVQSVDDIIASLVAAQGGGSEAAPIEADLTEKLKFTVTFKKDKYDIEFPANERLGKLREHLARLSGVAPGLQKLVYKGAVKDDSKTLKEAGIADGLRIMLIGTTLSEVMEMSKPEPTPSGGKFEEEAPREPLSEQTSHKKIVAKGPPEGAEAGRIGRNDPLPQVPLQNIYNNIGTKVRLTFKVWTQELWISSSSTTQKIPFNQVRAVSTEPIHGNEQYHIMSLQLGSSDKNKYFLYFVPCQYTRAIKNTIMSDYLGGY